MGERRHVCASPSWDGAPVGVGADALAAPTPNGGVQDRGFSSVEVYSSLERNVIS